MENIKKYQEQLKKLLIKSTLTNGYYSPSQRVKIGGHTGIFSGNKLVFLCGSSTCQHSIYEAVKLTKNETFKQGLSEIGFDGKLTYGFVSGLDIDWKSTYSAIVRSHTGTFESGNATGELVAINMTNIEKLTILMCINDSIAKIFDPYCPELDNGKDLSLLAK